jgi:hypothetical protein
VTTGDPTMRLVWLTDIHLNFLEDDERRQFLATMAAQADAYAISGDMAAARCRSRRTSRS